MLWLLKNTSSLALELPFVVKDSLDKLVEGHMSSAILPPSRFLTLYAYKYQTFPHQPPDSPAGSANY